MQITRRDTQVAYRERLSPSLWAFAAAALAGPMVALVFAPIDGVLSIALGIAASVALIAALVALSPVVEVRDGRLHAGRARIDVTWLGEPELYTGEDARAQRGARLAHRSWHLIRGGIDGVVVVPILDPADPVPSWVISSRTPDRLAAAVKRSLAERGAD